MKAAVIKNANMPLIVEQIAKPILGADDVLVRVKAAALNKRDWWIQKGQYAGLKYPIVPGSDGSGIVVEVGVNVDKSWLGKEVVLYPATGWGIKETYQGAAFTILGLPENGCLAEYVKVSGEALFLKPSHLSFEQAAALPVAGLTAFRALFIRGGWQKGDRVLISGVGGGAGSFALQWALGAGAEVWVTSGHSAKIAHAIQLGAKGGVNYKDKDWAAKLKEQAGAFDIIIDSALGEGFAQLVDVAERGARIIFFGGTGGNIPVLNGRPIFWKQISILGTTLGSPADFRQMLLFISEKRLTPIIDQVFPLKEAENAMRAMDANSEKFGKIIINIDSN